ncbi:hypothetical protein V1264_007786 [Littorina saxatilis]|uniref:Uncharacterized protein n=2 Tax=Littorina saxatilis TaxID=31220 RepID=A0AAN9AVM4_9CAEN
MSKLEVHQDQTANSTISIIVLVLGLVCGLILGLCIGLFIFRRRSRKEKEEEPSVFFSNPYYGDVRAPLNPPPTSDDFIDSTCCAGSTSYSQAPTPVKRPLCGPPLPKRGENIYNPNPTLKSQAADSYNDITAQKLLYAAGGSNPPEEGAVGNVYDEADLVDHHYDYSTGENFYETVDNVRLAIHQNALNEQQEEEERYVPFQFDSPAPEEEKN